MNKDDKTFIDECRVIFDELKQAKSVLVATHENPDGDALSSLCAVIEWLKQEKINHYAYCYSALPNNFAFLPNFNIIRHEADQALISQYSHIVLTDCATVSRSKLKIRSGENQKIISFDHHPKVEDLPDLELRDQSAASTTEIIYHFLKINKQTISQGMANCLLTGILTDTANFLYPSTSSDTMEIAAELIRYGAKMPRIVEGAWHNKSVGAMRVWGAALSNLEINQRYNIAFSVVSQSETNYSDIPESELDGIAGFLSNLHNVKAVLFLRDDGSGIIKGSLRTASHNVDVSRLAARLGGGGHAKASGFKVRGRLEKTSLGWKIIK